MEQKGSQRNQLQIPRTSPLLFSDRQLRDMILPLFFEQLLLMLVGIADTFVVSYCKEAAVSGVSLVNSFNTIFLFLFTALSSGGAVIVSQYLGRKENATASQAASQLFSLSLLFSLAVAVVTVVGNEEILGFLFGRVEPEVMEAGITYLRISAYSYPLLAVYNAGAALYRSIGKTSTTMYCPGQFYKCSRKLHRCVSAPCRGSRSGLALLLVQRLFRPSYYRTLF